LSDIFISYARDDLSKVSALASALDEKGWSVWWDQNIRSAKPFDRVIEYELAHAKYIALSSQSAR
jgi:TIR domain